MHTSPSAPTKSNTSTITPNPLTSSSSSSHHQNTNNQLNQPNMNKSSQSSINRKMSYNNTNVIPLILPLKTSLDNKNKLKNNEELKKNDDDNIKPKIKPKSIFDSSLNSHRNKSVSLSAFSHLFCELLHYSQIGVKHVTELEQRLSNIGKLHLSLHSI